MKGNDRVHIWLGTIASLITIVGWLEGIHSIPLPKAPNAMQFTLTNNIYGLILFIVSHLMVWASVMFISISLGKKLYQTIMFPFAMLMVPILSYCIELILFDSYYDSTKTISYLLYSLVVGKTLPDSINPFGDFLAVGIPVVVFFLTVFVIKESCCPNCKRLSLRDVSSTKVGEPYDEQEYITKEDGETILRINRYQNYEDHQICTICGNTWTSISRHSRGHIDKPVQ